MYGTKLHLIIKIKICGGIAICISGMLVVMFSVNLTGGGKNVQSQSGLCSQCQFPRFQFSLT